MAVIDSNKFITHLIWSGLVDKATCGELKEAIELCTVKDTYSKADVMAMLKDLKGDIDIMSDTVVEDKTITVTSWIGMKKRICELIQSKIDKLKGNENGNE